MRVGGSDNTSCVNQLCAELLFLPFLITYVSRSAALAHTCFLSYFLAPSAVYDIVARYRLFTLRACLITPGRLISTAAYLRLHEEVSRAKCRMSEILPFHRTIALINDNNRWGL